MVKKANIEYQKNKQFAKDNLYELKDKFSNNPSGTLVAIVNQEAKPAKSLNDKLINDKKVRDEAYLTYIPSKNNVYIR